MCALKRIQNSSSGDKYFFFNSLALIFFFKYSFD